jgi:DNA-binding transcriptional LysR family regulator
MDKLRSLRAFVQIVERGSLTAAAETLHVSQPSMVRVLAALESDLGVRLVQRTTRRQTLTDEGREFYQQCRGILGALDAAEAQLKSRRLEPAGLLRITSSVPFGRRFVAPVASDFAARHPALRVDLVLLDRVVDLLEEGFDIAVRVMRLADSSLVAIPVGETRRIVVGSPGLLRRAGAPKSLQDLAQAPCVSFTGLAAGAEWTFETRDRPQRVPVNIVLQTNQVDAAVQAAVAGLGWAQFFDYHVADELARGTLVPVLREHDSAPIPAQIVYPHGRLLSANVRAFVDFALPQLRAALQKRPGRAVVSKGKQRSPRESVSRSAETRRAGRHG